MSGSSISEKFAQLASDLHVSSVILAVIIDTLVVLLGLSIWYALHKHMQRWEKRHLEDVRGRRKAAISRPIKRETVGTDFKRARPESSGSSKSLTTNLPKRMSEILLELPNPWLIPDRTYSTPVLTLNDTQTPEFDNIIESFPTPPEAMYPDQMLRRSSSLATEYLGLPNFYKDVLQSSIYAPEEDAEASIIAETGVLLDGKVIVKELSVVHTISESQSVNSSPTKSLTTLVSEGKILSNTDNANQRGSSKSLHSEATALSLSQGSLYTPAMDEKRNSDVASISSGYSVHGLVDLKYTDDVSLSDEAGLPTFVKTLAMPEPTLDANTIRKTFSEAFKHTSVSAPHSLSGRFASFVVMNRQSHYKESNFKRNSKIV